MKNIERQIADVEAELAELDAERDRLIDKLRMLRTEKAARFDADGTTRRAASERLTEAPTLFDVRLPAPHTADSRRENTLDRQVTKKSSARDKIELFMRLFAGREDVYARRFESRKTGKTGYAPVCRNEWVDGICKKPKIACQVCAHRAFEPVTSLVIRSHLLGRDPDDSSQRDFTMGSSARGQDTAAMYGFSFPSRFRRPSPDGWLPTSLRARWSAGRKWAWTPTTASSRARTRSPRADSAI